jgi:DNA-binding NtrC family response regulator
MRPRTILVVDDEKNLRLTLAETLAEALAPRGFEVRTAANGREALAELARGGVALVLLDLQMPEMDGMTLLRQLAEVSPESRVIILTAHGTIADAVEATRLGAADFLQKPFAPDELRTLVAQVLDRERLDAAHARDYAQHISLAKRFITDRHFDAAREHVRRAIADDATRPEAFNLLGVLEEIAGRRTEALKQYRVALELDSGYRPAQENVARTTKHPAQRSGGLRYE